MDPQVKAASLYTAGREGRESGMTPEISVLFLCHLPSVDLFLVPVNMCGVRARRLMCSVLAGTHADRRFVRVGKHFISWTQTSKK